MKNANDFSISSRYSDDYFTEQCHNSGRRTVTGHPECTESGDNSRKHLRRVDRSLRFQIQNNNDKQEPEEVQPSVPEESPETTETPEPEKNQESSCEEETTIPESTVISEDTVAEAPSDVSSQETKTEAKEEIAVQDDNTRYTTNLNALAAEALSAEQVLRR